MSAEVLDAANALAFNVGFAVLVFLGVVVLADRVLSSEISANRGVVLFLACCIFAALGGLVVSLVVSGLAFADLLAKLGGGT